MAGEATIDLGSTIAGVRLPFCAMNSAGVWASSAEELRDLLSSECGAIVLRTATVHPFVHPEYRALQNPGYDRLVPLARELAAEGGRPVIASIAGATVDEYVTLARAFAEAGAALVEANLADPWVALTLAPCEDGDALRALLEKLTTACPVPLGVRLPDRLPSYRAVGAALAEAGIRVVVVKNDFAGFEKFLLEAGPGFDVVARSGIRSGYDVSRALGKGARAVQVDAVGREGAAIFARLAREMRIARGVRPRT
jgi:dihydroorotate dehydrogenase (NAD+) catalytic subunit